VILRLAGSDWIKKAQNIIITGPTGVGKTYLACALANSACRNSLAAMYKRAPRFYQEIAIARADGSYPKLMNKLAKVKVLVIDDFCITPMADAERRDLLEVIEDRQGISSTVVATQVPVENWFELIGDPTVADAILDRLIHNAHKINLKGESMRKIRSPLTKGKNSAK
jgi:DNA replication protein DnaC